MPLQIRRGTEAERQAMTVPLASGELLWITNEQRLYIGNGSTLPSSLVSVTGYTNENAQDAVAPMFTGGSHTGITFTYNDDTNTIDADLDLSTYQGVVNVNAVTGSVFADDSTLLVDGVDGAINLNGTVQGHIIPNVTEAYDLGSNTYKFRDLYLKGSSIHLGSATITAIGSAVDLPAGSTINGVSIGAGGSGVVAGQSYNINVIADNSTMIVNANAGTLNGNLTGDVSGNLSGNVTGNVLGNVTGDLLGNVDGDVTGNIISVDNAAVVLDTTAATAVYTGDVTGNVSGDVTGNVTGNVSGNVISSNTAGIIIDTSGATATYKGNVTATVDTTLMVDGDNKILSNGDIEISGNAIDGITDVMIQTSLLVQNDGYKVYNENSAVPWSEVYLKNDAGTSATSVVYGYRGTLASPTALQTSDEIFTQTWLSYNADAGGVGVGGYVSSANLAMVADTVSGDSTAAKIYLVTIPSNDPLQAKGIAITTTGLGVNTTPDPQATLDVNGFAKLAVLTVAPSSLYEGLIAIADGTSWDPMGTGKKVVVAYLAGGWRQMATAP